LHITVGLNKDKICYRDKEEIDDINVFHNRQEKNIENDRENWIGNQIDWIVKCRLFNKKNTYKNNEENKNQHSKFLPFYYHLVDNDDEKKNKNKKEKIFLL